MIVISEVYRSCSASEELSTVIVCDRLFLSLSLYLYLQLILECRLLDAFVSDYTERRTKREREREKDCHAPQKKSGESDVVEIRGEEIDKKRVEMRMKKKAEEENNDRKGWRERSCMGRRIDSETGRRERESERDRQ